MRSRPPSREVSVGKRKNGGRGRHSGEISGPYGGRSALYGRSTVVERVSLSRQPVGVGSIGGSSSSVCVTPERRAEGGGSLGQGGLADEVEQRRGRAYDAVEGLDGALDGGVAGGLCLLEFARLAQRVSGEGGENVGGEAHQWCPASISLARVVAL